MSAVSATQVAARLTEAEKKSTTRGACLRALFQRVELDDLLKAILLEPSVARFFTEVATVKALLDFVFEPGPPPPPLDYEPPASPGSPRKEARKEDERRTSWAEPSMTLDGIKTYCAEILTNPDSSAVFEVLVGSEALGYFFAYWKRPAMDALVFQSFLRLSDFLLQRRFHAFVRSLHVWDFVIPCIVMQLDVPDVRSLVHALIANEAFLVEQVPEVGWSRRTVLPLVLSRFRASLDNHGDSVEVTVMCEFLGELLQYHFRTAPHVQEELMAEFKLIAEQVLNTHSEYADEFLTLFMQFFPPRHGEGVEALRPPPSVSVCDLALECTGARRPLPEVSYNWDVEQFLSNGKFQHLLRSFLSREVEKHMNLYRWRAMQLVSRCLGMCCDEVDRALIASSNLAHFLDAFFQYPQCSMVHTLVLDALLYLARYSDTISWALVNHGFLARALDAYLKHADSPASLRPHYMGHLVRLFGELGSSAVPAIEKALKNAPQWPQVREAVEAVVARERYAIMPSAEPREGTLLERLALASSEEDAALASKPKQNADGEGQEEVEVIEEEIIEEIVVEE